LKNFGFFLFGFFVINGCAQLKEQHYLPHGYIGSVFIVYDPNSDFKPEKRKGYTIYNIPENGVLVVNKKIKAGTFSDESMQFFQVDSGEIIKRLYLKETGNFESDSIVVFTPGIVTVGNGAGEEIKYIEYYVGYPKDYLKSINSSPNYDYFKEYLK
jgi:hypothetical protein